MYVIRGKYEGCPWETIDTFENKETAEKMLEEYRMAFGRGWVFTLKVRVKR